MRPAIALFARAPVVGRVKTRLIGCASAEQAAELHRAFVLDAWALLAGMAVDVFLYGDGECAEWRELAGERFRVQRGADLGERLLACFDEMRAAGFGPLLIVGSDSPALPRAFLEPWTERLAAASSVLGPCEDGGYYAIGCRAPDPGMFTGVEWSSPRTLEQTAAALARCGLPPAYLPQHYDVDTPEDLARLAAEPKLPPHTLAWLRAHWPFPGIRSK